MYFPISETRCKIHGVGSIITKNHYALRGNAFYRHSSILIKIHNLSLEKIKTA